MPTRCFFSSFFCFPLYLYILISASAFFNFPKIHFYSLGILYIGYPQKSPNTGEIKGLFHVSAAFRSPYFGFIFLVKFVRWSPTAFIFFKIPLKNDNYPGLNYLIISIYPCTIGTIYPQNAPFFMLCTSCTKSHYHFWYICIAF